MAVACGPPLTKPPVAAGAPTAGARSLAPVTPVTVVPARQLAAETAITTPWGAVVTVPATWFVRESPTVLRVQDPERMLEVSFVAVQVASVEAAFQAAWKRVQPDFALEVADKQELPARAGWEAVAQRAYVTKADESRIVVASARRIGATWHVATIDGAGAALGARGAQVNAMLTDMKVAGVESETFAGKAAKLGAVELAKLDAFVEAARVEAGVPGAAIAVVHGGRVVLAKGYGVRAVGAAAKVTPETKFMIGSTTKSLTTLMLARLVDQKKLTWETPLAQVLPEFKLADPGVTSQVQVKHTVCACTGMPRQDLEFLFEYDGWDPERRLASMATMKPTTGFGETFQYSNLMVAAGGWVGGRALAPTGKLGPAYDRAMQRLVFTPLGMRSTTFDVKAATRGDFASPHGRGMGMTYGVIPVAYEGAVIAVRPAGAAWSTVQDMAKFVLLELAKGKTPDGKQLVSEANVLARRAPQVKITEDSAYGLGLFLGLDHGVQVVHHGGNNLGFTTDMFFVPAHDVGVVLLTNAGQANAFTGAVRRYLFELMFDGKPEAQANLAASLALRANGLENERELITPADDAWLAPLLGVYEHPGLGRVTLKQTGAKKIMDTGEWQSSLAKYTDRDGTVYVTTIDAPYVGIAMRPLTKDGKAVLVFDAGQQKYDLVRVAP